MAIASSVIALAWLKKEDEETLVWPMSGLLSEHYIQATSLVLSEAGALVCEG